MEHLAEPLFNDSFVGEPPTKRVLSYLQSKRELGKQIAGVYCGYAPMELFRAMDIFPAVLCAFSNNTIETAETVLPGNLCPLIKSSYGFIVADTCPFYAISDAVIAETTCDGKKKMFELIADRKPMHVMDLPQLPDEKEARAGWASMIRKLQSFLETTFDRRVTDDRIEEEIRDTNRKSRLIQRILEFAQMKPTVISWKELYDITWLAQPASGRDIEQTLEAIIAKLEKRVKDGYAYGKTGAPRVLVTGCPVGGDATKVFTTIEEAGGVVVGLDSCTGLKPFIDLTEENTGDPVDALAKKYLNLPCSCMTPNNRRLAHIDNLIEKYQIDAVIDVVLHACHSYNIESHRVGEHVKKRHNLPFLKIVTDYSKGDIEQIRTRVEALFEGI